MSRVESRRLSMHPHLLMDVIRRQAGTLSKSILEGVMNSVDAQAKRCTITLNSTELTIQDDGHGITERSHLEQFFETFGTPHTEAEGKIYGTFRMGRGQLFAYGRNIWRTGPFEMDVDVDKRGLDWRLRTLAPTTGCCITVKLYKELLPSELVETVATVTTWVRYCPIPIILNGETVSGDPAKESWTYVTDDAYIRLKEMGSLQIYNLGVHTLDMGSYRLGTAGVIVSKKQLKVNFARNDIQSDCPVFRRIKQLVDQRVTERNKKKTVLTEDEKRRFVSQLFSKEVDAREAMALPLLTDVAGKAISIANLCRQAGYPRVAVCARGDTRGDKIQQARRAIVLADETLERFQVSSLDALIRKFKLIWPSWSCVSSLVVLDFSELVKNINEMFEILPKASLTQKERAWLWLMQKWGKVLSLQMPGYIRENGHTRWYAGDVRQYFIGRSATAHGWTDGVTFIAIDRKFLSERDFDPSGITDLGALLIHEYCHTDVSTGTHVHSPEFYEAVHGQALSVLGKFVQNCLLGAPYALKLAGKALSKRSLRGQDVLHELGVKAAATKQSRVKAPTKAKKCKTHVQRNKTHKEPWDGL